MEFLFNVLLILHFVGLAMLVGGWLVQMRSAEKTVTHWMLDGALTQVVTGIAMVGIVSAGALGDGAKDHLDTTKIGVKLAVALVAAVLAFIGKRRPAPQVPLWLAVGLLGLANVVIAVVW
jgi:uncharacterized membrane protein